MPFALHNRDKGRAGLKCDAVLKEERKGSSSFLKKRTKKLLNVCLRTVMTLCGTAKQNQKFWG
jgi:hypothetical protein